MSKAILYPAGGNAKDIMPANGTDFQLDELQRLVGGQIEIHRIDDKLYICDEEGALKGKDMNLLITDKIGEKLNGPAYGDWIICDSDMVK